MKRIAILTAGLLAGCTVPAPPVTTARQGPVQGPVQGELPGDVRPSAYAIAIDVDMRALRFAGHETIEVGTRGAGRVVMNQDGLSVGAATIDGIPAAIASDGAAQTLTLTPPRALSAGTHRIVLDWTGPVPASPSGLYHDDYTDPAGVQRRMLVTQFEVAAARRMFPGWDEPAFKARFDLTATLPDDYVPIANMPVAETVPAAPGRVRVHFQTAPAMSSYLLALFAGHLSALHATAGDGVPIGLYAPSGAEGHGAYALQAATALLPYYDDYFGVRYPLPKLDLIAVPGNYEAGAMENWGAISFIDNALLFDPATSSPETQQTVYLDVAHEMAHQWSGDLVTMRWWDDIWLNEGFATWMELKATEHFNPSWNIWAGQHDWRERAMGVDGRATTHPIHQPIANASEADAAFDAISYQKGSQIIRMIEDFLGPDTFRDGMRRYMAAHAYGSATSADLWAALSAASGQDVAGLAGPFVDRPGVPLVRAVRSCADGKASLALSVARFSLDDPHAPPQGWRIPVRYGFAGQPARQLLLDGTARIPLAGCEAPLKLNLGENGYFRTEYDEASLALLRARMTQLAPVDRADLLDDQFALFQSGQARLADWLGLLAADRDETSLVVLRGIVDASMKLDGLARDSPDRAALRTALRAALAPAMARLGWQPRAGEAAPDTLARPLVLYALGRLGDQAVRARGLTLYRQYARDPRSVAPSLIDPAVRLAGMADRPQIQADLARRVRQASETEGKLRFFDGMVMTSDPALVRQALDTALSGDIPNGRIGGVIGEISSHTHMDRLVWQRVLAEQAGLRSRLTSGEADGLLADAVEGSDDPAMADALLAQPAATPQARLDAQRRAAIIRADAALGARIRAELHGWAASRLAADGA